MVAIRTELYERKRMNWSYFLYFSDVACNKNGFFLTIALVMRIRPNQKNCIPYKVTVNVKWSYAAVTHHAPYQMAQVLLLTYPEYNNR